MVVTQPHPLQPLSASLASDFPTTDWPKMGEPLQAYWLRVAERVAACRHLIPEIEMKERAA